MFPYVSDSVLDWSAFDTPMFTHMFSIIGETIDIWPAQYCGGFFICSSERGRFLAIPRWIWARVALSDVATGLQSLSAFRSLKLCCDAAYIAYEASAARGATSSAAGATAEPSSAPTPSRMLRRDAAGDELRAGEATGERCGDGLGCLERAAQQRARRGTSGCARPSRMGFALARPAPAPDARPSHRRWRLRHHQGGREKGRKQQKAQHPTQEDSQNCQERLTRRDEKRIHRIHLRYTQHSAGARRRAAASSAFPTAVLRQLPFDD